ncbi:hydroxycarboxylic acid receptor 2-like, partial [Pimephales promelas]
IEEEDMSYSAVNFTIHEASTNPTNTEIDILGSCLFGFSSLFGLPTHFYVIWLILTGTQSGVASEFFNLNLSVCGIFVSVNALLILVSKWFPFQSLTALTQFFFGLTVTGHPLFQCLMCAERYLAVVHPVTFLKYKPLRYRVICCTALFCCVAVLRALKQSGPGERGREREEENHMKRRAFHLI